MAKTVGTYTSFAWDSYDLLSVHSSHVLRVRVLTLHLSSTFCNGHVRVLIPWPSVISWWSFTSYSLHSDDHVYSCPSQSDTLLRVLITLAAFSRNQTDTRRRTNDVSSWFLDLQRLLRQHCFNGKLLSTKNVRKHKKERPVFRLSRHHHSLIDFVHSHQRDKVQPPNSRSWERILTALSFLTWNTARFCY